MANILCKSKRTQVISCLVEGNSIRATVRLTGVAKNTVVKLLADVGRACSIYQDRVFRGLTCKQVQCDEVWSFVGAKEKNTTEKTKAKGWCHGSVQIQPLRIESKPATLRQVCS